jgi:hypothetical protein
MLTDTILPEYSVSLSKLHALHLHHSPGEYVSSLASSCAVISTTSSSRLQKPILGALIVHLSKITLSQFARS